MLGGLPLCLLPATATPFRVTVPFNGVFMSLKIILALLMIAVVGVLSAGVFGLATGSPPERSNKLMRWRIILQGAAIVILALIFMTRK